MSDNLFKSGYVIKNEKTRVIDSNSRVAARIEMLTEMMEQEEAPAGDGFVEGLDALQVEQLMADTENGENSDYVDPAAIEEITNNANVEAERILSEAAAEAERVIEEANRQAEAIRNEARQAGHDEGYLSGVEEGNKKAEEIEKAYQEKEAELKADYEKRISELEPMFVDKLTDIYEHIFNVKLKDEKDIALYLLKDAVRNVEGAKNFLVHVSKDDFAYVSEHKEELMQGLPGTSGMEIVEDMTLSGSECFVEAESGIFDCSLGTELSLLRKELMLLAYAG